MNILKESIELMAHQLAEKGRDVIAAALELHDEGQIDIDIVTQVTDEVQSGYPYNGQVTLERALTRHFIELELQDAPLPIIQDNPPIPLRHIMGGIPTSNHGA